MEGSLKGITRRNPLWTPGIHLLTQGRSTASSFGPVAVLAGKHGLGLAFTGLGASFCVTCAMLAGLFRTADGFGAGSGSGSFGSYFFFSFISGSSLGTLSSSALGIRAGADSWATTT